jgi:hypothetical protein
VANNFYRIEYAESAKDGSRSIPKPEAGQILRQISILKMACQATSSGCRMRTSVLGCVGAIIGFYLMWLAPGLWSKMSAIEKTYMSNAIAEKPSAKIQRKSVLGQPAALREQLGLA